MQRRRWPGKGMLAWAGMLAIVLSGLLSGPGGPGFGASSAWAGPGDRTVPVATAARLGGDGRRTRFVLDLSDEIGFSVFVLADPFRVIIDLPEVDFQLPAGLGKEGRGLVSAYRYGLFSPGKSRIVIDAENPVLIEKSFVLNAFGDQPARLVVDLVRTDRSRFDAVQRDRENAAARLARELSPAAPVPPAGKQARESAGAGAAMPERSAKTDGVPRKPLIVIDPGHGGVDPGAIGFGGTPEKKIVLDFGHALRRALKASGRYRVMMTRDHDTFLTLRQRVQIARSNDADLFVALHADAAPRARAVRGATVYTLSERASDAEAAALAAKENRADLIAGVTLEDENDEVTGILIDLAQRETKNHSVYFAKLMVKSLSQVTRTTKRPHRFAGFRVLKAPDVPSVLLEMGFLTSRYDEKLLQTDKWRKTTSKAVVAAIDSYFAARTRLWGDDAPLQRADVPGRP